MPIGKPKRLYDRAMSPQQQAFIREYLDQPLNAKNPKAAALAAGYSPRTAAEQSRRLMTHPRLRKLLLVQDERHMQEIVAIDSAWVLNELAQLWETDLRDLFSEDGRLKNIKDLSHNAQKLIASFQVEEVVNQRDDLGLPTVTTRTAKVKLIDPMRVLENIGKHMNVNAFGSAKQEEALDSFSEMMRAATKALQGSNSKQALDVTSESRRVESGD